MKITYRVYTENKAFFRDFDSEEQAVLFRYTDYHGPIIILEDGKETGEVL